MNRDLKGKKIAGIDFGLKRVGIAICDELHISITPRTTLRFDLPGFWSQLLALIRDERIDNIVVGLPLRNDKKESEIIKKVKEFAAELESKSGKKVELFDESYSSNKAVALMLEVGKRKSLRQKKSELDKIAAAVILRDFLNEIEG